MSRTMALGLALFITSLHQGCLSTPTPDVSCVVINLEYVNCSWNEHGTGEVNYTFESRFSKSPYQKCPWYFQREGVNVGCKFPCETMDRFNELSTRLTTGNIILSEQRHKLKEMVKLDPPTNLSVALQTEKDLWLYWNSSSNTKPHCTENEVQYRVNKRIWTTVNANAHLNSYNLIFPSTSSQYEFQVRTRIPSACGESRLWSDWSKPVFWGNFKESQEPEMKSVFTTLLSVVAAAVILIILSCLLVHIESLRVILIPVVPSPSKNLLDLFDKNDENSARWLRVPKDTEQECKAHFIERPCSVCEYQMMHQSSSESESALSLSTDQTDYVFLSSYSSASTLPITAENSSCQTSKSIPLE